MSVRVPGIPILAAVFSLLWIRPLAADSLRDEVNVTGVWDVTVETSQSKANPILLLRQDGERLTGTYQGRVGEAKLEGTVKGNDIRFSFTLKFQDQPVRITYSGKIRREEMGGTVEFGDLSSGTWTAKKRRD